MSISVLDASALMALLKREPGAEQTAAAIRRGAAMSTVNLSEVVAKLLESQLTPDMICTILDELKIEWVAFDSELAHIAGQLRPREDERRDRHAIDATRQRRLHPVHDVHIVQADERHRGQHDETHPAAEVATINPEQHLHDAEADDPAARRPTGMPQPFA